ncbi:hypothetical protein NKG99_02335 [Mesorhizobium sp. M1409]|uniref:P-loop ATPase, Sll1717 family n=1 Tax=unclassified Mesorhizobium TaxID=325217 RepID=UPI00333801B0
MTTIYPTFGDIRIGEPDANVEYYSAIKAKRTPIFLDTFFAIPNFPLDQFLSGEKFLIYGQKGTGKTAAIRYLENRLKNEFSTYFLVFRRSFLEESDLHAFSKLPLMLDEVNIERFKHFHHAIKRILIFILIKQTFASSGTYDEDRPGNDATWVEKIKNSTLGELISLGFDSITAIFNAAGVNLDKVTVGTALLDAGKLLKRNNDDLLNFLVRRAKRLGIKACIFVDEIHFAYRSEEALQQDAMLVRDCILAMHSLNDRFSEEQIDLRIYSAVRSEYLEHPIISSADVNHSVESVGYNLTWSSFPQNKDHPLFKFIFERFKASIESNFSIGDFFRVYMANIDAEEFLHRTWVKPRDFVRFFKCAKELYSKRSQLSSSEINAIWRIYAQLSWSEIKSSASPFMNSASIAALENEFRKIVPSVIDKHTHTTTKALQRYYAQYTK